MKQHEAVILALERLGGVATLGQLNQSVLKISDCKWGTKTPFASIRRIVQTHSKEIYKIKPGLYGLVTNKKDNESKGIFDDKSNSGSKKEVLEFNHTYYQGLIVTVGNLKSFFTFVPNQDKNRTFVDKKLGEISTLQTIPPFSFPSIVKKSSSVDVIWFNSRQLPDSLFEVEHSTDIQNSLLKFNELQDFNTRMLIVADKTRKREYDGKIKYSAFKGISSRVRFLDYESLTKQYENLIEQQSFDILI